MADQNDDRIRIGLFATAGYAALNENLQAFRASGVPLTDYPATFKSGFAYGGGVMLSLPTSSPLVPYFRADYLRFSLKYDYEASTHVGRTDGAKPTNSSVQPGNGQDALVSLGETVNGNLFRLGGGVLLKLGDSPFHLSGQGGLAVFWQDLTMKGLLPGNLPLDASVTKVGAYVGGCFFMLPNSGFMAGVCLNDAFFPSKQVQDASGAGVSVQGPQGLLVELNLGARF